jgi:hyperosmotically inducible protein
MRLLASILFAATSLTAHAADKPDAMKIPVNAHTTPAATTDKALAPTADSDNSVRNEVHDGKTAVTADQQGNSKADVELTSKIRRAIVSDKSLSTYAHNVKIISYEGKVVLKGPVRGNDEKNKVESVAKNVAGADHVVSEIEVK